MDAPARRYDLLAIDLDGTLLNSAGAVSTVNRRALERAREAGMRVVVCTGRGLKECRGILSSIAQLDPVVVAGGSIVACPVAGRTLVRYGLDKSIVVRACARMLAHGHPALILKDPAETGYDYIVVQGPDPIALDPVTEWWFEAMGCTVRYAATIEEDEHPDHTVRIGACGASGVLAGVKRDLIDDLGADAAVHHFPAVVAPQHVRTLPDGQTLDVLEVFHGTANKWTAVSALAAGWSIDAQRIAAIGDQINDLCLMECAGLGVAMGNAIDPVLAAARRRTKGHDEDGVAYAVDHILDGAW